ncbi:MAG TPA: transaldolase [Gemmatimonadales bacterium]|jgi:transaldolase
MSQPLQRLTELGQSIWYDFVTRDLIHSGELKRLVTSDHLRGMTSNPTIFEKAVAGSSDYDEDIRTLSRAGESPESIVEALMVKDVKAACDVFRPVYDQSGHGDGTVSIEVSPRLAHDTEGTIEAAHRLWRLVDRPNLMVKIPGTAAGLPAIAQCLADGININITLLFSVERYKQVIDAFFSGLERRIGLGLPVNTVYSVASFFVSRVDGQTDPLLVKAGERGKRFLHQMAIANARVAYGVFGRSLMNPRWQAIATKGAKAQRPLWASTSTKDPGLSDIYYAEALLAPDTVNTLPPDTFRAYNDHGHPEVRITPQSEIEAEALLVGYEKLGVAPLAEKTAFLEDDGVRKFSDSWTALIDRVKQKAGALAA